ncbi:hypothetical protein ACIHCQ_33390 [Streptomyces sp. NPDC052236]|uniref:hypothetical protein n=1 Tax=Streptomyces sp. NPDC052236 TaxID=3365686 RepID=UPI0037D4A701
MRTGATTTLLAAAGIAPLVLSAPVADAAHLRVVPAVVAVDCGPGWRGLAVFAVTAKGKSACPTAQKVATAYGRAVAANRAQPVTVYVGRTAWKCQERQGDPNPYGECVSLDTPGEKVRLSS